MKFHFPTKLQKYGRRKCGKTVWPNVTIWTWVSQELKAIWIKNLRIWNDCWKRNLHLKRKAVLSVCISVYFLVDVDYPFVAAFKENSAFEGILKAPESLTKPVEYISSLSQDVAGPSSTKQCKKALGVKKTVN